MQYSLKQEACGALGGKNIFTPAAIEQYLLESDCSFKEKWAEEIQKPGRVSFYVTTLADDVSKQKRRCFRLLRVIQLKEFLSYIKDEDFLKYVRLQLYLYDGSVITNRDQARMMVRNLEIKLLQKFSHPEACKCEVKQFLTVAMLCSEKHFLYHDNVKKMFLSLCQKM